MPSPPKNTNVTFSNGSNPNTVEIGDNDNDSLMDQMGNIIEGLYESNELLECPGGQRRGWKILTGDSPVEFVPCGCYDDALWPYLLGIPAAAKAGATLAAKLIIRKAKRKYSKKALFLFLHGISSLERSYKKGLKLVFNYAHIRRKLPPVQPGYKRLYRGQGDRKLQQKARNNLDLDTTSVVRDSTDSLQLNTPDGKFWSDDILYSESFVYADRSQVTATDASEVFFIDIPIEDYNRASLGNRRNTGNASNLQMIPEQKYLTEAGARWDKVLQEYTFPPNAKMPLRRRLQDGSIGIVDDVPDARVDMDLNPGVFAWNAESAKAEFYLDSSMHNTNFLDQAMAEANLAKESTTQFALRLKEKTNNVRSKGKELEQLLAGGESVSSASAQQFIAVLESSAKELVDEIDRIFDVYDLNHIYGFSVQYLREMSKTTFSMLEYIKYFLPWLIGLLAFIEMVMNLVTIVKDKSCIPFMEGGLSEFSNKDKMSQIRSQRIANKAAVWAELNPETCKCSECPGDWNFCDQSSLANLYLKETNTCIPPCCGGQEFKPITLIETCKCNCPDGQVFMPCECSDCFQSDSSITKFFNPSKPGKCVNANPDPEKLEWNPKSCSWECKNYTIEYPSYSFGTPVKKPLKPCKDKGIRQPSSCECSGAYEISPCVVLETLQKTFNIVPITELRIIE